VREFAAKLPPVRTKLVVILLSCFGGLPLIFFLLPQLAIHCLRQIIWRHLLDYEQAAFDPLLTDANINVRRGRGRQQQESKTP